MLINRSNALFEFLDALIPVKLKKSDQVYADAANPFFAKITLPETGQTETLPL